jgi:tetraacyldisaccharide 4'-kinase
MDWPLPIRILLWPLSLVYGLVVRYKTTFYRSGVCGQKRLNGAVVSVGNITVGGTGKTPMVLWLAEKFLSDGKSVAILSRGYRGEGASSDEVELMRKRLGNRVRFGIGADRFEQGSALERASPVDVFLLDDGFQHLKLARDLDIVMLDGSKKLKDEWLLPAGSLREPISACSRADLLIVTRKFARPPIEARDSNEHRTFYAQTQLLGFRTCKQDSAEGAEVSGLSEIGPGPFFSFCGIGNPKGFADDLERWQVPVVGSREFRDHHQYAAADLAELESAALAAGAVGLITTEKDEQNLRGTFAKLPLYVAVIDLVLGSESEFAAAIEHVLAERRSVAS